MIHMGSIGKQVAGISDDGLILCQWYSQDYDHTKPKVSWWNLQNAFDSSKSCLHRQWKTKLLLGNCKTQDLDTVIWGKTSCIQEIKLVQDPNQSCNFSLHAFSQETDIRPAWCVYSKQWTVHEDHSDNTTQIIVIQAFLSPYSLPE